MEKIGLTITINKFNTYFETKSYYLVCDNIDEAKNKLTDNLVENFRYITIDFPLDLIDFEYLWFKQQYVNTNAFVYKIFTNGQWTEPWETQDIYDEVLEKLEVQEIENVPDFSKMYGEPDPDIEADDNFNVENNEQTHEFETKLKEIISQAQSVKLNEDSVKDCQCEKCQEGYKIQQMKRELETEYAKCVGVNLSKQTESNINMCKQTEQEINL